MTVFPFLIDSRPAYLQPGGEACSLLLAPLATRTLLRQLASRIARHIHEGLTVLTTFPVSEPYEQAIRSAWNSIDTVAPADQWARVLARFEPSDWILLIDPRSYSLRPLDLRGFLREAPQAHAARHLVALETSEQGTREYVQLDGQGQVNRIRRYYEGVTWLQAEGVSCSLVSASCLRLLEKPTLASLLEVRGALAACGVPSQDVLLQDGVLDLRREGSLLRLVEQSIMKAAGRHVPPGYRQVTPGVYAAEHCRIDPTARIHGAVVIQQGAAIGADALVIGPTLLGAGSHIQDSATVAQCVVMPCGTVAAGMEVHHRVACRVEASHPQSAPGQSAVEAIDAGLPLVPISRLTRLANESAHRRTYPRIKHAIDVTFAVLGLLILSPLLAITAALVRLDSHGPLLFGHEREGKDGKVFRCWKFRTMVKDAHARQRALYKASGVDGPQFKIDKDPRITRVGWLLRATNIDELPQLINVLCGQMSLIGPRPSPFRENQICIPWRQARLSVRPGITGLWQICRSQRANGDFHQWIHYDMLYVRHMSLWLDIKILVATVLTMGGRWGMPVSWIIPAHKLHADDNLGTMPMPAPAAEEAAQETATADKVQRQRRDKVTR